MALFGTTRFSKFRKFSQQHFKSVFSRQKSFPGSEQKLTSKFTQKEIPDFSAPPWDKILSDSGGGDHASGIRSYPTGVVTTTPGIRSYPTGVATTTPGISSYPMVVVIIHAKMMYLTQVDLRYL